MRIYEGKEKYIFISYAHKDSDIVLPILQGLSNANYRVWYDGGIAIGSEWPENVAEHLSNSEVVFAFLSQNSLDSQNCTREINFAIAEKKKVIAIFLEDLSLSPGMRMQLGTVQAIYYKKYKRLDTFLKKLFSAEAISECKKAQPKKRTANAKKPAAKTTATTKKSTTTATKPATAKKTASSSTKTTVKKVAVSSAKTTAKKSSLTAKKTVAKKNAVPEKHTWTYEEEKTCCRVFIETYIVKHLTSSLHETAKKIADIYPELKLSSIKMRLQIIMHICLDNEIQTSAPITPLGRYSSQNLRAMREALWECKVQIQI